MIQGGKSKLFMMCFSGLLTTGCILLCSSTFAKQMKIPASVMHECAFEKDFKQCCFSKAIVIDDTDTQNANETPSNNPQNVDLQNQELPESAFYAPAIDLPDKWYEQCEYGDDYATGGEYAQVLDKTESDHGTISCGAAQIDYRCSSFGEVAEHLAKNPPADNGPTCWCRLRVGDKVKKWVYNYTYNTYDSGNGCESPMLSLFNGGSCRQHCASWVKQGDAFWLKRLNYNNLSSLTILPHGTPADWNKSCLKAMPMSGPGYTVTSNDPNQTVYYNPNFPCGTYADKEWLCTKEDEKPEDDPTNHSHRGQQCWFRLKKGDKQGFWLQGSLYESGTQCPINCTSFFSNWLYHRRGDVQFINNGRHYLVITSRSDL